MRSPVSTRRALLHGFGDAAAGAALALAGDSLIGGRAGASDDKPRPPSPGEELMTEHGVLKRVLLAYRAVSRRLADGEPVDGGVVMDAAQIVSDYVEGFHEGLEEAYVFPRVAASGRAQAQLVQTLVVQHDRGRHLTAGILELAATDLATERARGALNRRLDSFVAMYEPHEAWEDTVVYPTLRAVTPQRVLDELADRFASYEAGRYSDDALAAILQRVVGVEERLGIGVLSAFTPPEGALR